MSVWPRKSFARPKLLLPPYPIVFFHQMLNAPAFNLLDKYCSAIEVVPVFLLTDHFQWPEYCSIISKYWQHIDRASISQISTI